MTHSLILEDDYKCCHGNSRTNGRCAELICFSPPIGLDAMSRI